MFVKFKSNPTKVYQVDHITSRGDFVIRGVVFNPEKFVVVG